MLGVQIAETVGWLRKDDCWLNSTRNRLFLRRTFRPSPVCENTCTCINRVPPPSFDARHWASQTSRTLSLFGITITVFCWWPPYRQPPLTNEGPAPEQFWRTQSYLGRLDLDRGKKRGERPHGFSAFLPQCTGHLVDHDNRRAWKGKERGF